MKKKWKFRKPGKWIESRLFNKDGTPKKYDAIEFRNGYGKTKPYFICGFRGIASNCFATFFYSNKLEVITKGDYVIFLGAIIRRRNMENFKNKNQYDT